MLKNSSTLAISQSQCSAQGQVFHCKFSILHSTLFSAFLFVSSYSPFIIMLSYLISSSALNFLPIYHSFQSILQQAVPSQPVAQPIYFPPLYQFQHYSSFSHSFYHNCIFYFISLFYTFHPSPYPHLEYLSHFCSFCRCVQVSAPYNATLHTKHFTSLFLSSSL